MPYSASMDDLLATLRKRCPEEIDRLEREWKTVRHGLLSVGIKLHVLRTTPGLEELLEALGGKQARTELLNAYRKSASEYCIVLPPVGSAQAAIRLLQCIGRYAETPIFDNPDIHLQVCSPGQLDEHRAAYLGIAFYLASDTLRLYSLEQFETTASEQWYHRKRRLVIHDAKGDFDRGFAWWRAAGGKCIVESQLPFIGRERTDVIVGKGSPVDIENINLIATLLVHTQFTAHGGYWRELGKTFEEMWRSLLQKHQLPGIVEAPWVRSRGLDGGDESFAAAFQELMQAAYEDSVRMMRYEASPALQRERLRSGILKDAYDVIATIRTTLTAQAAAVNGG
jgi:hypothetical protein